MHRRSGSDGFGLEAAHEEHSRLVGYWIRLTDLSANSASLAAQALKWSTKLKFDILKFVFTKTFPVRLGGLAVIKTSGEEYLRAQFMLSPCPSVVPGLKEINLTSFALTRKHWLRKLAPVICILGGTL